MDQLVVTKDGHKMYSALKMRVPHHQMLLYGPEMQNEHCIKNCSRTNLTQLLLYVKDVNNTISLVREVLVSITVQIMHYWSVRFWRGNHLLASNVFLSIFLHIYTSHTFVNVCIITDHFSFPAAAAISVWSHDAVNASNVYVEGDSPLYLKSVMIDAQCLVDQM